MVSFLMMLALAPVEWGFTWMYASPLRRMDGYFWGKLIVRVVLAVAILGGLGAQLNFVANREPSLHARQFYLLALLIIEAVQSWPFCFTATIKTRAAIGLVGIIRQSGPQRSASKRLADCRVEIYVAGGPLKRFCLSGGQICRSLP